MENKNNNAMKENEKLPYEKPELKPLGKLSELIRGAGSCGPADLGEEHSIGKYSCDK